jgi:hypothetical protein
MLREIDTEGRLLPCHALLHKMTHFVSNYLFYLSIDVLAAKPWTCVLTAGSVWEARERLDTMLSEVLAEFSLDTPLYKAVNKVLSTCGLFSAHMGRFVQLHLAAAASFEERADALHEATSQAKFAGMMDKFEDAFQGQSNSLLVQLKALVRSNKGAGSLIARLDFNSYFSVNMGI